jgi:hypothetical protein
MELHELLDKVEDQESFLAFARALLLDKEDEIRKEKKNPPPPYSSGANGWENDDVSGFLESAIAWAEDSDFGKRPSEVTNTWKKFALFLYGGKIYE